MDLNALYPSIFTQLPKILQTVDIDAYPPNIPSLWLIGGSVRDFSLGLSPRDYDVMIDGIPDFHVAQFTARFGQPEKTRMGGWRWPSAHIDCWTLQGSPLVLGTAGPTVARFLQRTTFSIDGLAILVGEYHQTGRAIITQMCVRDLEDKIIRLNPCWGKIAFANAARALYIADRTGFTIEDGLRRMILDTLAKRTRAQLEGELRRRVDRETSERIIRNARIPWRHL